MTTPGGSSPEHTRKALARIVHDSIGFAAGWIAALLVFFAGVDPYINPPPYNVQVAIVDALVAAAFLAVFVAHRQGQLPVEAANSTAAAMAMVVGLGIVHDVYFLQDPEQTTYLMLVMIGAGTILLSTAWLAAVVAVCGAAWLSIAFLLPSAGDWVTFGFSLFATVVVAFVTHTVRLQTYSRMERLRLREAGRTEELQIREEALQGLVSALQESEDRYRMLVDQAPDAFLVLADRKVRYVNAAGVRLFGASTAGELLGRDALELVHPDYADLVRARNAQIEREGKGTDFMELKIRTLDGRIVEVETLGQPITFMGEAADQTIVRDITDRKRAEQERLLAAKNRAELDRLKEVDRVKTQFVNTISHELRTPLTPVKVQLHLLKKGIPSPETYAKSLNVLDRNFQRLNGLVDELLEVARIQAGTLKISRTYVDLSGVIAPVLESYADVAKQAGVDLTAKVEDDLDVMGDARRLTQVMYNLMGNAFKFTPVGGHVHVAARREGDAAIVTVHDSGAGLTKAEIARLFEPFSQVHDTMEKTNAGTGLGLFISRGIVEGHEGRIWCESDGRDKGSTFAFRIPLCSR